VKKMKFEELTINKKLIEKTHEEGYEELTLIQEKCLPAIIKGNDVVGQAETGSGKTVAFCLPILEKITPRNGIQAPNQGAMCSSDECFQRFWYTTQD